ncbi:MAG: hypothetical protein Fur0040_06180 [Sideroxydans sp.]
MSGLQSKDSSGAPEDEVMCQCSGTRRSQIFELYAQGLDLAAISRWTGALSGCGGCEWDIADFLRTLPADCGGKEQGET